MNIRYKGWMLVIVTTCVASFYQICHAEMCISVYKHMRVEKEQSQTMRIAEVDLAAFGYVHLYHYVLVKSDYLFVLGQKQSEEVVLSAISLDSHTEILIGQYDTTILWFLSKINWNVFFLNASQQSQPFVLIEYRDGNMAEGIEETETYLEVYRLDFDGGTLLQREIMTELHIWYAEEQNRTYTYSELINVKSDDEPYQERPAHTHIMKYMLSDVNSDEYADILIWKGHYVARAMNDSAEGDFYLEHEVLYVMYFEPEEMTFSPMTLFDSTQVKELGDIIQ